MSEITTRSELTEGLHGLDQFEGEGFVFRKLLQHPGHFVVPRPHNVLSVDALHLVAHTDDLHLVHHTALFDTLSHTQKKRQDHVVRQKDIIYKHLLERFFYRNQKYR